MSVPATRPIVAVGLPDGEQEPVLEALEAGGYDARPFTSMQHLRALLEARTQISVALIDLESDFDAGLEAWELVHGAGGRIPALVILSPSALEHMDLAAASAAEDEYVTRPLSAEGLRWQIEAMCIRSAVGADVDQSVADPFEEYWGRRGSIIAVFNPKGGVGKTTIATNLATTLALRREQRAMLVDADIVTGHVATSFGVEGIRTMADAWNEELEGGPMLGMEDVSATHATGLRIVSLASNPMHVEILEPKRVAGAISRAARSVDWVVVDLHPAYSPLNLAVFEIADRILVPVTPDLPAIRAAVQFREAADELGILDRLALIVNRADSGVAAADVERTMQLAAIAQIRSSGVLMVKAANEGRPVVEMASRQPISRDFEKLADRVLGTPVREASPGAFRLFRRPALAQSA